MNASKDPPLKYQDSDFLGRLFGTNNTTGHIFTRENSLFSYALPCYFFVRDTTVSNHIIKCLVTACIDIISFLDPGCH